MGRGRIRVVRIWVADSRLTDDVTPCPAKTQPMQQTQQNAHQAGVDSPPTTPTHLTAAGRLRSARDG